MIGILRRLFTSPPPAAPAVIVDEAAIAAAAVAADRARVAAILTSPAAIWREQLALGLAYESDLSAEAAIAVLRTAPTGRPRAPAEALARCGRVLPDDDPDVVPAHVLGEEERPQR